MKRAASWFLILAFLFTLIPAPGASAASSDGVLLIPENTVTIEEEAFAGDTGFTTLVIPNTVKKIEARAFAGCTALTEVFFGNNAEIEIAPSAFADCREDLHTVVYPHTPAELFSLSHGFACDLADSADYIERAKALVEEHGGISTLQGEFDSMRLLVQRSSNRLPDISAFHPTDIIRKGDLFVVQLSTEQDTMDCYNFLLNDNWEHGNQNDFVEPDRCVAATFSADFSEEDDVIAAGVVDDRYWETDDPMGFDVYAPFVAQYGSGSIKIAVIDSGISEHASYSSRLDKASAINFVPDDENWSSDSKNHGSYIASVINECAQGANVQILPIRVVGDSGGTGSGIVDNLLLGEAIDYAVNHGASIINLSMNFMQSAYVQNRIRAAASHAMVVVSAGNAGGDVSSVFPANMPEVITVGGLDFDYKIRGNYGTAIDYCAPYSFIKTEAYGNNMGTSFSAPMIATALAMVSLDPYHTLSDMDAKCERFSETGTSSSSYGKGMPRLDRLADIPVVSISFSSSLSSQLKVNDSVELSFVFDPENATNKIVNVVSSNNSVLAVESDDNGTLFMKAKGKGTATLTATSASTGVQTSRDFTVVQPVTGITITGGQSTLPLTRTLKLSANVAPADASTSAVEWISTNNQVATVDQNGLVTPHAKGTVQIYAVATDGSRVESAKLTIQVVDMPDTIEVVLRVGDRTVTNGSIEMTPNSTVRIDASVLPDDSQQEVVFEVLGNYVLKQETGELYTKIKAVSPGTSYIRVTSADGKATAQLEVRVLILPESITISGNTEIDEGSTTALTANVLPTDAYDRSVRWSSGNENVATVSSSGIVTGVKAGTAVITATANGNTSVSKSISVTVKHPFTISFNLNSPEEGLSPVASATSMRAYSGESLGSLPSARCDYYYFLGWYNAASGGQKMNDTSVINTEDSSVTLYAQWRIHEESAWVLTSSVPEGARITQTSYSYRENTESTDSTMAGWIANGSSWKQSGTGTRYYASFPGGFNTGHWIYQQRSAGAYQAATEHVENNKTVRRDVSNTQDGWIYWHWAYNVTYASVTNRSISGWNTTGIDGYSYCYFYAMESTTNCPYLSNDYCNNQNLPSYNAKSVVDAVASSYDKTSSTSGLQSDRFFRFERYRSTYTDYVKWFKYYRELNYQPQDPGSGSDGITITNKTTYVKYRNKVESFVVTYNVNGGDSGTTPASQTKEEGVPLTLSSQVPTKEGDYPFLGWATSADATEAEYQPGGSYTLDASVTLFAVWGQPCEHSYTAANMIPGKCVLPTDTEPGYLTFRCSKCGKEIVNNYPDLTSGDYTIKHVSEPTCSETGLDTYKYNGSDAYKISFNIEIPVVDHDYVDGVCRFCGQAKPVVSLVWSLENGTLRITGEGEMPSYNSAEAPWYDDRTSITSIIVGEGITGIGSYAFYECGKVASVVLPNSLTSIGDHAFYGCGTIPEIDFPADVSHIGEWAFGSCSGMTDLALPDGAEIGNYAFYRCSGLTHVTIPANTSTFGCDVFTLCDNLKTAGPIEGDYNIEFGWTESIPAKVFWDGPIEQVTIPNGMTSIGDMAFMNTKLQHVSIPNGLNTIGTSAFQDCNSLKTAGPTGGGYDYEFPWTESIPANAFANCKGMDQITLPNSLTSIGNSAFAGTAISSISIPDSVSSIGQNALRTCKNLTHVALPGNLTSIPVCLLYQCSGLVSVSIPSGVTAIELWAFDDCASLNTVYYAGSETQWQNVNINTTNSGLLNATVVYNSYVP